MPIYEFRCQECDHICEFLFTSSDDQQEMKCPRCGGEQLERVLSRASFSISGAPPRSAQPTVTGSKCAGGSCSTLELPGLGD